MKRLVAAIGIILLGAPAAAQWHTADTAVPQGHLSLSELLRVIQFYNSGGMHCAEGTEDGYAPGPGDHNCAPHDIDYRPQDWLVSLGELLRLIQFYNVGGYFPCPDEGTEDGFCLEEIAGEGEGEGEGQVQVEVCGDPNACVPESVVNWPLSDIELLSVAAGSFSMGRSYTGVGFSDELPVHTVALSAYRIGKYEITNKEFAEVLTWAYKKCYLTCASGLPYNGGVIYSHGKPLADIGSSSASSSITFSGGVFLEQARVGADEQVYPMTDHPVIEVSWYGAVAWCNWRSEIEGLQPCYNFADWSRYAPVRSGYRLPTEAEWERAAAWDGTAHIRYGFTNDALEFPRANFYAGTYANPLGLTAYPYTSPVGWFDGAHVSPNNAVQTVDSPSPVGAYDMSGNAFEWCEDWYLNSFYGKPAQPDPVNATPSLSRVLRGGAFNYDNSLARAAYRNHNDPKVRDNGNGFRVVRSP